MAFDVTIGSAVQNSKTVSAPGIVSCPSPCGKGCRQNPDHSNAGDRFEVTVLGGQVTARRLDAAGGWGMDLVVPCCKAIGMLSRWASRAPKPRGPSGQGFVRTTVHRRRRGGCPPLDHPPPPSPLFDVSL